MSHKSTHLFLSEPYNDDPEMDQQLPEDDDEDVTWVDCINPEDFE